MEFLYWMEHYGARNMGSFVRFFKGFKMTQPVCTFTDDDLDRLNQILTNHVIMLEEGDRYIEAEKFKIPALLARLEAAERICRGWSANHPDCAVG